MRSSCLTKIGFRNKDRVKRYPEGRVTVNPSSHPFTTPKRLAMILNPPKGARTSLKIPSRRRKCPFKRQQVITFRVTIMGVLR